MIMSIFWIFLLLKIFYRYHFKLLSIHWNVNTPHNILHKNSSNVSLPNAENSSEKTGDIACCRPLCTIQLHY